MYSIRKAKIEDREAISKIWRTSFTEDQNYIDSYLNYCFPFCKGYFLFNDDDDDGSPVSYLSVLPSYISEGSGTLNGGYIYSVATLPEHRGKGYAGLLIEEVARICKNSGYAYLVVKPASAELFPYYEKLKFSIRITSSRTVIDRHVFSPQSDISCIAKPLTGKIMHKLRVRSLSGYYFLTIPKIVNYAVNECISRGGVSTILEKKSIPPSTQLYCLAYPDENDPGTIILIETNAKTNSESEMVFGYLFNHYKEAVKILFSTHNSFFPYSGFTGITSALALSFKEEYIPVIESRHFSLPIE